MTKASYENNIAPHLKTVEKMLAEGSSEKSIYETLGVSRAMWYSAKKTRQELKNVYENAGKTKEVKVAEKFEIYMDRKQKAEQKLEEALDNGQDWAIRYVLDTYEEHTPYHKTASIKLREREIANKEAQTKVLKEKGVVVVTKLVGDEPLE